ncbi:hypothetical protein [Haliea atlantica]
MNDQTRQNHYVSPFAGEPYTENLVGVKGYRVRPCELSPEGIKRAEAIGTILAMVIWGIAIFLLTGIKPESGLAWYAGLFGPALAYPLLIKMALAGQRREAVFDFTADTFSVWTGRQWLHYDRTLKHRFVMMTHDRAREEEEERELQRASAQKQGRAVNPKRYYADSYHIILQYMGQRHDLMTVYDKKRASAVLARLKVCDEVMDNALKMGEGEAMTPGDQWDNQPGDLPD